AFAAGETGQLALDAAPAVFRRVVGDEDAFGRLDALQAAVADGDGPPGDDLAVAVAAGDLFLVAIALPVAVEDPRDRRVPPVDDLYLAGEPRRLAEQDVELALPLTQPKMREVRRVAADLRHLPRRAQLIEERGLPIPLVEEGGVILLLLALAERLAKTRELLDERRLRRRRRDRRRLERGRHPLKQGELFGDDRHAGFRGTAYHRRSRHPRRVRFA